MKGSRGHGRRISGRTGAPGDDDAISLLQAGKALECLLLTITEVGLQYCFLNASIQRADLRDGVPAVTFRRTCTAR